MSMVEFEPVAQLHSVKEARRRLNIGLTKMYELINSGELTTVKIGSRRLISEAAIAAFINARECAAIASEISEYVEAA